MPAQHVMPAATFLCLGSAECSCAGGEGAAAAAAAAAAASGQSATAVAAAAAAAGELSSAPCSLGSGSRCGVPSGSQILSGAYFGYR